MGSSAPNISGVFEQATFIRLKPRSKQPDGDFDRAKCDYASAAEWVRTGSGNVGIILDNSTPLLDVDIDEPRLLPIADHWLPATPWAFGRDTSPRSHRLFVVPEPRKPRAFSHGEPRAGWKEKKFVDLRCKMQGKAGYTVVPPGTHQETGERIVWMTDENVPRVGRPSSNDPPTVDYRAILEASGVLAGIAIAAACWGEGGRHDLMLALEGYLAKRGWDIEKRRQFIHDVNDISDHAWSVRERDGQVEATLRNTQRKIEAGDKEGVAGISQLISLMGEKQAKAFRKALEVADEKDDDDDGAGHGTFSWDGFARAFGEEHRLVYWEDEAYAYSEENGWRWVHPGYVDRWALNWLAQRQIGKHGELKASPSDVKDLVKISKLRLTLYSKPPVMVQDDKTVPDSEWLMGVGNGIVDLRTGDLTPYTPDVFLPRQTDVPYDPTAKCPRWDSFLSSLVANELDVEEGHKRIRSIEEMLAYPLTRWRGAQKIFTLIGPPRSGKGTMLRLLERLLGRAVTSIEFSDLGKQFGLETIIGRTALYIHEPAANFRHTDLDLITSRLKAISGGDEIGVNRKHQRTMAVKPELAIILATNEFPKLNDASGALASRFHHVVLTESFLGREDVRLDADLAREADGVLARLVTVCREIHEQLTGEGRVTWTMTRAAVEQQDETAATTGSLLHFSQKAVERFEGGELLCTELFDAYQGYCDEMGATLKGRYRAENGLRAFMSDVVKSPLFHNTDKGRRNVGRHRVMYRSDVRLSAQGRAWAEDFASSQEGQRDAKNGGGRGNQDDMPF